MATTIHFPPIAYWLARESHELPVRLRELGTTQSDLEIDFYSGRRPELVTSLLMNCSETASGERVDLQFLLKMPVGLRMEALLELANLTDGRPFSWRMICENDACRDESEFEIGLQQLLEIVEKRREEETLTITVNAAEITVRRPTAADQMRWLTKEDVSDEEMLYSLVKVPPIDELLRLGCDAETLREAIDSAMEEFDPLVGFSLTVVCPHCGCNNKGIPDITAAALERLARKQHEVLEDIHKLAMRYHWNEREILNLPAWRRQSYLDLIEQEEV